MSQKSAFEVYSAMQKAGTSKPSGHKQKQSATANTRPQFVVPPSKNKPKKRKQADVQAEAQAESEAGSGLSNYDPVLYDSLKDQMSSPKSRKPNGNSSAPLNGKKPAKQKQTARKQMPSSKPNTPHLNGAVQEISDSESDAELVSSPPSSSRSDSPSPTPETVQRYSSWFSEDTVTSNNATEQLESHSIDMGCDAFKYVLSGVELKHFMSTNWEKEPLFIERHSADHYARLGVSRRTIDEMLRTNTIEYTKNLDVTMYENGVRETKNPVGRAYAASVWQHYGEGCSVRLLNPQTYMRSLHRFNATLQEYFHCMVGANIYLTPPNSQGFAPHYDDIEAFVLQIEGQKEWLLYPPRSADEVLPRTSSPDFRENELGEPLFRHILKPGDMLYFPRGWIHQARTVENQHSLHITLSVYQKNSLADMFEDMLKQALEQATKSDVSFRRGLPLDIWSNFGTSHAQFDGENGRRQQVKNCFAELFRVVGNYLDIDDAVDRMAMKFQHDALPPVLSSVEKQRTSAETVPRISPNGLITMPEIRRNTRVRLIRANIVRLVNIDNEFHLYYYLDNSKEYHENDLNFLEVDDTMAGVVRRLIQLYPKFTRVQDLAPTDFETAQTVVYELWDRGILMTDTPLK